MSSCTLDKGDTTNTTIETTIMKIEKMISDNYAMILVYVVFAVGIGFVIWYFGSSLIKRIKEYNANKSVKESSTPSISNNSQNAEADNNVYDGTEPSPDNINDFMEPGKKGFVKQVDQVYKDYNKALKDFITSSGKKDEDAMIDVDLLFKTHDEYKYDQT